MQLGNQLSLGRGPINCSAINEYRILRVRHSGRLIDETDRK